jgi:homocysteine S-methyltransferase
MTDVILLDGGMGQELIKRSTAAPTNLWSTQVMLDNPGMVAQLHRDFTAAGATIATTNTYAIHRDRLEGTPYADRFTDLMAMALAEARVSKAPVIAGAIGPLRASYRPDLHPDADTAAPIYAEVAQMIGPSCDLIICESVASVTHAEAVLRGAQAAGKPVWLACTVQDTDGTRLRSGELLADVIPIAQAGASALLINCSSPEALTAGMPVLADSGMTFGGYANAFEQITEAFLGDKPTVDALQARKDMTPQVYADRALSWVDAGATIIGGCCEVSPAHIAEIASRLRAAGHTII